MSRSCAACSTSNRTTARFCKACGAAFKGVIISFEDLAGIEEVQREIEKISRIVTVMKKDGVTYGDRLHTILMGNTGTGKSSIVRIMAGRYHELGLISSPTPIIYDAVDFDEFQKKFAENFRKAKGSLLCIENVQKLIPKDYSQHVEPLDRLLNEMSKEENRQYPIVVLSGLPQGMREYLDSNDAVKSKFRFIFSLPDHSSVHLSLITIKELEKSGFTLDEEARTKLVKVFAHALKLSRRPDYHADSRNAWLAQKTAETIKGAYYLRIADSGEQGARTITPYDITGEMEKEKSLEQVMAELDGFIGMNSIKMAVRGLIDEVTMQRDRAASGVGKETQVAFHIVLTGNPGTGKTTVARVLGEIFKAVGVLDLGHTLEVDRSKLVAGYVGQTAPLVNANCDRAMGGVLFIDEAYSLKQNDRDSFGQEAIDALLKRMEDARGKFIVVIAGYPKEMAEFLKSNPGLESRFVSRYRFHLEDYTPEELLAIFIKLAKAECYELDETAVGSVRQYFKNICANKDKNFGNGREARNLFENCRNLQAQRVNALRKQGVCDEAELSRIRTPDIPCTYREQTKDIDAVLRELNSMTGLMSVKKEINSLISFLQIEKMRADQGGTETKLNLHFVFRGNPGTGKTTVARVVAAVFTSLGLISKGHLVEVKSDDLVGEYIGATAPKTNKLIDSAMGGVLFIDEAYTLAAGKNSFGKEAIDTLLVRMENDRGKFIVIAAGYSQDMAGFLQANPGLTSRFTRFIDFEDYTPPEMLAIYHSMMTAKGMAGTPAAEVKLQSLFEELYATRDRNFANGRTVRNIFEQTLQHQATRLAALKVTDTKLTSEQLSTVTPEDIPHI
ncbi:MAG: AAA family ATPase [Desulfuromonadales bacterium]